MKSTGMVRQIDHLGRVVLPKELRDTLGIVEKDSLEIFVERDSIILRKYCPSCIFCGGTENVTYFKDKRICEGCLAELNAL